MFVLSASRIISAVTLFPSFLLVLVELKVSRRFVSSRKDAAEQKKLVCISTLVVDSRLIEAKA